MFRAWLMTYRVTLFLLLITYTYRGASTVVEAQIYMYYILLVTLLVSCNAIRRSDRQAGNQLRVTRLLPPDSGLPTLILEMNLANTS